MKNPSIFLGLIALLLLLLIVAGSLNIICLPIISSCPPSTPKPLPSTKTPTPPPTTPETPTPTVTSTIVPTITPTVTPTPITTPTDEQPITSTGELPTVEEITATGISKNVTLIIPPFTPLPPGEENARKLTSLQRIITDDEGEAILRTTKCQTIRLYKKGELQATYCSRAAAYTNSASCLIEGLWSVWDKCKTTVKRYMETQDSRLEARGTWYVAGYSKEYNVTMLTVLSSPKSSVSSPGMYPVPDSVAILPFQEKKVNGDYWEWTLSGQPSNVLSPKELVLARPENLSKKPLPKKCPKLNEKIELRLDLENEYARAKPIYDCLDELGIKFYKNLPSILDQYRQDTNQKTINQEPPSQPSLQPEKEVVFPLEPPKASKKSVDFKKPVIVGEKSSQSIIIENKSDIELDIQVSITDFSINKEDFTLNKKCQKLDSPKKKDGIKECEIEINFTPSADGKRTAELKISHNADSSIFQIPLTGIGIKNETSIKPIPDKVDFKTQDIADSPVQRIEVSISGTSPVEIAGISLGEANSAHYAIKSTSCNGKVLELKCFIDIEFKSKEKGTHNEVIIVKSQYLLTTGHVLLDDLKIPVTGKKAIAEFVFIPDEICFERQKIYKGKKSDSIPVKEIVITNTGKIPVKFIELKIKGNSGDFLIDKNKTTCGNELKPEGNCKIVIGFTPRKKKIRSDTLLVFTNTGINPTEIKLSGIGKPSSPVCRFYYKHIKKYKLKPCK